MYAPQEKKISRIQPHMPEKCGYCSASHKSDVADRNGDMTNRRAWSDTKYRNNYFHGMCMARRYFPLY